jgi:hypothetical protein
MLELIAGVYQKALVERRDETVNRLASSIVDAMIRVPSASRRAFEKKV